MPAVMITKKIADLNPGESVKNVEAADHALEEYADQLADAFAAEMERRGHAPTSVSVKLDIVATILTGSSIEKREQQPAAAGNEG